LPRWKTVSRTLTVFPDPDGLATMLKRDQPHTDFSPGIGAFFREEKKDGF
jgi:hypothetical protein